jgi:putative heme-binding domain-containing protein
VPALESTLKDPSATLARRNAVWTLTRIQGAEARAAARTALKDKDANVRQAALESISLHRDAKALPMLLEILRNADPASRRVAAEALGRIGDKRVVPDLLRASAAKHDRILEHSLTFALIELDDPSAARAGLKAGSIFEKRTALIALDQMEGGNLGAKAVASYLADNDALLRQTAAWILRHHPDWGAELTDFFRHRLAVEEMSVSEAAELRDQLAEFSSDGAIQGIMAQSLANPRAKAQPRQTVLEAMAQSGVKQTPPSWKTAIESSLQQSDDAVIKAAINAARALTQNKTNAPNFAPTLIAIGTNTAKREDLRLEALAAVPRGLPAVDDSLFQFLCASMDVTKRVSIRSSAVTVLARSKLNEEQLLRLTDTIKTVGPLEMTRLLPAFSHSTNETIGLRLVAALKESKGVSTLRSDQLTPITSKYPQTVQVQAGQLLASLKIDAGKQRGHIDELLAGLKGGDIRRGQTVFNSQKAACSTCHAMGYLGGHVGPDLTSIGTARTERDLLESIVYPSASFVRSFEPYIVTTKTDDTYTGVIKKEGADEIVLATGPTTEARLARSDIAEMRPGAVSIMPAGLDQQLTKQELADLVTFLKSTKWGPK